MARVEIISAFTGEVIGYFGDTAKEKENCTKVLSEVDVLNVYDEKTENIDIKKVYVRAFKL